jgi:hypothetical protein
MRVVNICIDDYANFSHENARCLRSVGVDCLDFKLLPHSFCYNTESTIVDVHGMLKQIMQADLVQLFHSDSNLLRYAIKKPMVVWHTGTRYRQQSQKLNQLFNRHVQHSFIALGEFAGKGAKNEVYSVGAIDTENILPRPGLLNDKIIVGHYPSNPHIKGTDIINKIVGSIDIDFEYGHSMHHTTYKDQLQRMQLCDIYLELFAHSQNGKPYGSWGITALEAAAMGKVVFTNHTTKDVYKKAYGVYPGLEICNTQDLFKSRLEEVLADRDLIMILQAETRQWVVDHHSYEATGKRLKKILGI